MAILYKANETDFNHFGLGPLNDGISILVTEERNGIFELEMQYPISGSRFYDLKLDRLIKADAGHNLKDQRFRIIRITKPMDGIVTVYAEHVSYLARDLALKPAVSYSGSAQNALNTWKNNIVDTNSFIVSSDITTNGSGSWSIKDIKNARDALGGSSGSILESYGGEFRFDNYSINLMSSRGIKSSALIAYGRNLVDLTQEEAISETYTSIYPYSVYQDEKDKEVLLTLPEFFVDSEYVGNYARRRMLPVDFSEDEIKTEAALRSRAITYMKANEIGIPKVNMTIQYVDLAKTLDYEKLIELEEINLCDTVFIYFEDLDVNTQAKVIKTIWDDLLGQYDSIEIGESRAGLAATINSSLDGKLETVTKQVNIIQLTADGLNIINRGSEEPAPGNIGDLWYEPDGIYENMYQWDGSIWKLMLSTRALNSVSEEVAKHTDEIATATESINNTITKADQAIEDAGFAKVDSAQAIIDANTAKADAGTAITKAETSIADSLTAIETAQDALDAYNKLEVGGRNRYTPQLNSLYLDTGASSGSYEVLTETPYGFHMTGNSGIDMVLLIMNVITANGFWTVSFDLKGAGSLKVDITNVTGETFVATTDYKRVSLTTDVTNHSQQWTHYVVFTTNGGNLYLKNIKIERANKASDFSTSPEEIQLQITNINGEISQKVSQTSFNTLQGTVSNQSTLITQSQTAIGLKADRTVTDTINSTIANHALSIEANAESLTAKAEKSLVDTINGTVSTHTTQIKATSDGLLLKADSSVVNTLSGTVSTHTGQISANSTAIGLRLTSAQVETAITAKNYVNQTTLNATSSGLTAQITQVSTDLNNLEIGGTNLWIDSNAISGYNTSNAGGITSGAATHQVMQNIISVTPNSTIIYQVWNPNKISNGTNSNRVSFFDENMNYLSQVAIPTLNGSIYQTLSIKIPSNSYKVRLGVIQGIANGSKDTSIKIKFEKGTKATDWSPAPEDMATVERVVTIEANINGIQATVANKAEQSQVTQLAGQITSVVNAVDTIDILPTISGSGKTFRDVYSYTYPSASVTGMLLIETPITSSYMTVLRITGYNYLTNNSDIDLTVSFYAYTGGAILNHGFSSKGSFVIDTVQVGRDAAGKIVILIGKAGTVWQYPSINIESAKFSFSTPPDSYRNGWTAKITPSTSGLSSLTILQGLDIQSMITQTASDINLRVTKAGIMTQLNLNPEGILLQGKNIMLDGNVTMNAAFISRLNAIEVSADRITTGTLNAANVNLINLNVSNLVGDKTNFVKSAWNTAAGAYLNVDGSGLVTASGSLSSRLNAGSLTTTSGTKSGTVNALGMQIADSSNGETTRLHSDGLEFQWYGVIRGITQMSEGLEIKPTTGSGARLNSSLALTTGPGNDKIAYLQLANPDGGTNSRLEMNGTQLSLRHPNGGSLDIADYAYNGLNGRINAGKFQTTTSDGRGIEMAVSQLKAMASNQTIYIMPSGSGELRIGNGSANPTLWPIRAASFVQGSSRDSKTNIEDYLGNAVNTLNELQVVTYNRKDELDRGIEYQSIGFIAEDSPAISAYQSEGAPAGVDNYKMVSLAIRGVQELSLDFSGLKNKIELEVVSDINSLKDKIRLMEEFIYERTSN